MPDCLDKFGRSVSIGSRVRLIELSPKFLESLPPDEIEDVKSMIGEIFEVYEIDSYGYACVEKEWRHPEKGLHISHSISLKPNEIVLIDTKLL